MDGNIKALKDDSGYLYPVTLAKSVFISKDKAIDQKIFEIENGLKNNEGLKWLTDIDLTTNPLLDNTVLGYYTDGKWRPMQVRGTYYVELDRWGIRNDLPTNVDAATALNNSGAINNALNWASSMGYTEVVLPVGTYIINEFAPIQPPSFMTFNLGGATLRIRDNDQEGYAVVQYNKGQMFSRITNGKVQGDRYNHNYVVDGVGADTHEGGKGIFLNGDSTFISIDNLEIFEFTGDSMTLLPYPGWWGPSLDYTYWEAGALSTTDGSATTSTSRIRTKNYLDISGHTTYISIVGNSWGDFGGQVSTEIADIFFYDTNHTLLKTVHCKFFDDTNIPSGAVWAKVVLYQSAVPTATGSDGSCIQFGTPQMNRWTYIERCKMHDNRRCGLAGGGKHVFLRDNDVYSIRGIAPGTVIDIEDGYGLNQYWSIEGNRMYDSKVGLSFVSTKHVTLRNNEFRYLAPGTIWDECVNFVSEGNRWFNASIDCRGECTFIGDQWVEGGNLILNKVAKQNVIGCYFQNSNVAIQKDTPFTAKVDSCRFSMTKEATGGTLFFTAQPQIVSNCHFEGNNGVTSFASGQGSNDWQFFDCTFLNTGSGYLLPGGRYSNCLFNNAAGFQIPNKADMDIEYFNCTFMNNATAMVYTGTNGFVINSVKFDNCKINGMDTMIVSGNGIRGTIEFRNNNVKFASASTMTNLFGIGGGTLTYTLNKIIIDGNRFTSNKSFNIVGVDQNMDITNKIFTNNYLDNVTQDFTLPGWVRYNNYNNGVLDPHLISSVIPTTGYYRQGEIVKDSNMATSGYLGWACTLGGLADTITPWKASSFYNQNVKISYNGYIYLSMNWNGKTSATAPAFNNTLYAITNDINGIPAWTANATYAVGSTIIPTGVTTYYYECTAITTGQSSATEPTWGGTTVTDNGVTWFKRTVEAWKCLGPVSQFKRVGALT